MDSDWKLYFCTIIRHNEFWDWLLSVIVGWLNHFTTKLLSRRLFFGSWEFPVSWRPRDYEFHLVWKKWHDKIRLGYFVKRLEISRKENISVPTSFSHAPITDRNQPQNSFRLIVVQTPSFPSEPILLHSTGLISNSNQTPPPNTCLLGRPIYIYEYICIHIYEYTYTHNYTYIHVCMYIYIYMFIHIFIWKPIYRYIWK